MGRAEVVRTNKCVEAVELEPSLTLETLWDLTLPACFPEHKEALEGLEGFSHIFVIAYFHRLRSEQIGPLKVKPRGLLKHGFKLEELPLIGVFALDSPTRPNPIGLSLVPLLRIEGTNLVVSPLCIAANFQT